MRAVTGEHRHSRSRSQFVTLDRPAQNGSGIPDGWRTVPLRSLCLATELTDPTKSPDMSFQYVDVSAVSNDLWKITGPIDHLGTTAPSRARKLVRANDVIFATVRPTLRHIAMIPECLDGQIVSTAFCVLRADSTLADSRFIYYSLLTDEFIERVGNLQRGASYPAVTDGDVLGQEIFVPPLSEQRAIATVLAKIQAAVEVQDRIVATLKELKAATMAKLFREGLRGEPLKQTELGEIPETWEMIKLGATNFSKTTSGGTPNRSKPEFYGGDIPWVKSGELNDGIIIRTEETITEIGLANSSAKIFLKGTLLLAMYGATAGMTGILSIDAATNQAVCAIFPIRDSFSPEFVRHYLTHVRQRLLAERHGGAQPNISQTLIRNLLVPKPSREEQEDIAKILVKISQHIGLADQRCRALKYLLSSMLHQLMTGQVRVNSVKPGGERHG